MLLCLGRAEVLEHFDTTNGPQFFPRQVSWRLDDVAVHGPRMTAVQVRTRCGIIWAIGPQEGQRDPRKRIGVSDRSSLRRLACALRSITPTHATLSATGYILLQPEPAKATAWSLPEHLHGHLGQGLATGR